MELQNAKEIVNSAINIAMQKGCFTLQENQAIIQALEKLNSVQDIEFEEVTAISEKTKK
jgi:hypothetical protein